MQKSSTTEKSARQVYNSSTQEGKEKEFVVHDYKTKSLLDKALKCNMLTISAQKSPEYYLKLIRHHFIHNSANICLQALGGSVHQLTHVACLVHLKGYATYKKIKNDHITVPLADKHTGCHLGLVKKVRLTIKIQRTDDFFKKISAETGVEHKQPVEPSSFLNAVKESSTGIPEQQVKKIGSQKSGYSEEFDDEDLILKTKEEMMNIQIDDNEEVFFDFNAGEDPKESEEDAKENEEVSNLVDNEWSWLLTEFDKSSFIF